MKPLISLLFFILFTSTSFAQLTNRLDRLDVNDLKAKKLEVISTTSGSIPCPKMTQTERNNIASPIEGQCIYNSTVQTLNLYDGSAWVEVAGGGGGGGIDDWQASKFYQVGDVVIYLNEIYQCIEEHTSGGSFDPTKFQILAQNLDKSYGVLSMSRGGTEKALTPELGGIVYTDAGSMEVLAAGVSGKFLQSNGAAAPTWETVSIDADVNAVSNLEVDNLKSGVLNTSSTLSGASDSQVPSALAVKSYADSVSSSIVSSETSFTVVNNQSSQADITGLVFDPAVFRSVEIKYSIYRQTDTALSGKAQVGNIRFVYNTQSSSWLMSEDFAGQDAGVEFFINNSTGQISYKSSNIAGSNYVGTLKYSLVKTFGI